MVLYRATAVGVQVVHCTILKEHANHPRVSINRLP